MGQACGAVQVGTLPRTERTRSPALRTMHPVRVVRSLGDHVHAVAEAHSVCMCTASSNVNPFLRRALSNTRTRGEGGFMVVTLIGYLLLALFALAVLAFCWLTASCLKLRTRSSHSGTSSLTTTVGTRPPSLG